MEGMEEEAQAALEEAADIQLAIPNSKPNPAAAVPAICLWPFLTTVSADGFKIFFIRRIID
jgi:hypothetical protein